ncbi:MAG: phosphatidylserine decarboxylase family protein [Deltaproteobacteria bacterium]|nr:phosphatidylserine decarboxylase family protein [Deltaproteobacteria bacterium]
MSQSKDFNTRIENRLPVAREGLPFIFTGAAVTIIMFSLGLSILGIILGLMTLFTLWFFRDPDRSGSAASDAVLSPADGTIVHIGRIEDGGNYGINGPALKISIFMSIFNVHVNRIPVKGRISGIKYNPGRFFSANLDKASEQNENNRVTLETWNGHRVTFVQIAGLIARRIACWVKESDPVDAGQRFGIIRFGSRVDIYLPDGSRIGVKLKERVKAGQTVMGYLP